MSQTYSINDFKAQCFDICKQVVSNHQEVILNKYGKPFVRIVPYHTQLPGKLGALQGTAILLDDLVTCRQKPSQVSSLDAIDSLSSDTNINTSGDVDHISHQVPQIPNSESKDL